MDTMSNLSMTIHVLEVKPGPTFILLVTWVHIVPRGTETSDY